MASKRRSNKKCSKRKVPVRSHRRPSIGRRVKAYCKRKSRKTRSYKRKSRRSCPSGKVRVPSFRTRSGQVVKSFCAKKRGSSRRRYNSYKKKRSYTYSYKPSVPSVGPNCLVRSLETCADDPNCQVRGGNMCVARRGVRQGSVYQGPMLPPSFSTPTQPIAPPVIPLAPVVPNPVQIMGLSQPFKSATPIYVSKNAPPAPMIGPMCTTRALNVCEQEPHCVKRGKQCVARSGVRKGYFTSALAPYTQKSFEETNTTQ